MAVRLRPTAMPPGAVGVSSMVSGPTEAATWSPAVSSVTVLVAS